MKGKRLPDTWRGGDEMKKLVVAFDDQFYADLKELSRLRKTTMADLIRFAVDKTFEDELDAVAGQRAWEEHMRDPSSTLPLDEVMKELGVGVSNSSGKSRSNRTTQASPKRSHLSPARDRGPAVRSVS